MFWGYRHFNHKKVNSWVSFASLYGYGAACQSSAINSLVGLVNTIYIMTSKLFGDLCIHVYLEWWVIHQLFNSLHNDFVLATISIPFTPGVCKCRCCQCHFLVNVIFQPSFLTIKMKLINTFF